MDSSGVNYTDENVNILSQSSDLDQEALDEIEKKLMENISVKQNCLNATPITVYEPRLLQHCTIEVSMQSRFVPRKDKGSLNHYMNQTTSAQKLEVFRAARQSVP